MKIGFIGGGNMACAILEGCLAKNIQPSECYVVEINEERHAFIKEKWPVHVFNKINEEIMHCDIILLAVKPQQMKEVAEELVPYLNSQLIISIAAGITLSSLNQWLGNYTHLVRAMPNMAALVHLAITGLASYASMTKEKKAQAETFMQSIGDVFWVENEEQLDAVTAISGSGPAYVFYFIEALQKAGENLGFSPEQAKQLALKTFEGASKLAITSDDSPEVLRRKVTSKGGTTEAALNYLEEKKVSQHFIEAVKAAEKRAKELGQ